MREESNRYFNGRKSASRVKTMEERNNYSAIVRGKFDQFY